MFGNPFFGRYYGDTYFGSGAAVVGGAGSSGSPPVNVYLPPNYWNRDRQFVADPVEHESARQFYYRGQGTLAAVVGSVEASWHFIQRDYAYTGQGTLTAAIGQGLCVPDWKPRVYSPRIAGGTLVTKANASGFHYVGTGNGMKRKKVRPDILRLIGEDDPELARLLNGMRGI